MLGGAITRSYRCKLAPMDSLLHHLHEDFFVGVVARDMSKDIESGLTEYDGGAWAVRLRGHEAFNNGMAREGLDIELVEQQFTVKLDLRGDQPNNSVWSVTKDGTDAEIIIASNMRAHLSEYPGSFMPAVKMIGGGMSELRKYSRILV